MRFKWIILLLVLCIPSVLPILRSDFYHFSDEPHIANLYQMIRSLESGQIPPRMAPDMSYNYGYPLFNFYYVLPFYLGSLFFYFTHSLIVSLKLVFLISVPLSAILMYLWLKKHTTTLASLVGAIIYVYTPYRAVDLYVRGAIGEVTAFALIPLVGLMVYKSVHEDKKSLIGLLGLVIGLFILNHNLAPIIFLPWLGLYGLILALGKKDLKKVVNLALGFLLGLGLSAYWLFPAFLEKNLLQTETPFNYFDHFPFLKQLILPSWGYGASHWGPQDDLSFQIGLVNLLLVIIGTIVALKFNQQPFKKILLIFFSASFIFSIFLMNIRSNFIWESFSLAGYFQFPWRILMFTTFITTFYVIFFNTKQKILSYLLVFLAVLSIILTINYFQPSEYFQPDDDYFLKRFFPNRTTIGLSQLSDQYKNYSEDYLLLPKWVEQRPTALPVSKLTSENIRIISIEEINSVNYKTIVESQTGGLLEVHFYDFPGWSVMVDDNRVPTQRLEPLGNFGVRVGPGQHTVRVFWEETIMRKFADGISLVSAGIIVLTLFGRKKLKND